MNTDQITLRVIDENLHISGSFGGLGGLDSFSSLIHDDKTERDEVSDATSQNKSNGERALYFALSWIFAGTVEGLGRRGRVLACRREERRTVAVWRRTADRMTATVTERIKTRAPRSSFT